MQPTARVIERAAADASRYAGNEITKNMNDDA
jgi:hypothetical protein